MTHVICGGARIRVVWVTFNFPLRWGASSMVMAHLSRRKDEDGPSRPAYDAERTGDGVSPAVRRQLNIIPESPEEPHDRSPGRVGGRGQ